MKFCWIPLLLVSCAAAATTPSDRITNIPGRTTVSLDGAPHAIVHPFENGKERFFGDARPRDKSDLLEYSFDLSPVWNVPGDWNTQPEGVRISQARGHAGRPGLSQPQGSDFESRAAEGGVLYAAEVLREVFREESAVYKALARHGVQKRGKWTTKKTPDTVPGRGF